MTHAGLNGLKISIIFKLPKKNGRVVFLSSVAHKWANSGDLFYAKLFREKEIANIHHENGVLAYAESKLLLILAARALARRSWLLIKLYFSPGRVNYSLVSEG